MSLDMLGDANAMAVLAVALAAALLICGAFSIHRINRLRVRLHLYLHTFETASVGITHVTLDGRDAIHHGHPDIHDDEAGHLIVDDFQRLRTVPGLEDDDVEVGQTIDQLSALLRFVVDDQNRSLMRRVHRVVFVQQGHGCHHPQSSEPVINPHR